MLVEKHQEQATFEGPAHGFPHNLVVRKGHANSVCCQETLPVILWAMHRSTFSRQTHTILLLVLLIVSPIIIADQNSEPSTSSTLAPSFPSLPPLFFLPKVLLLLLLLHLFWLFGCDCGGNWRGTSFLNPFHAAVQNLIRFTFFSTACFGTWRCTNPTLICSLQIG